MRKIAMYLRLLHGIVFTQKCCYNSNSDNNDNFTGLKQDILDKKPFSCNIIRTEMSA